jgi:hypothetical protein
MSAAPRDVLKSWLLSRLQEAAADWLIDRATAIASGDRKALFLSFGLAVRKTGKAELALSGEELAAAEQARPGWDPANWSIDQAARVFLVLHYPSTDADDFRKTLDQMFATGEVHELVALYQALPLFPHPEMFVERAAEGIRSNIRAVFLAVSHNNPFPAEQFSDDQWNQMVLKALFIGVTLDPIVGLDRRANAELARILLDYAHERWAAKRPVSPELWRCVGPATNSEGIADLRKVLDSELATDRDAALLALSASSLPAAQTALTEENLAAITDPAARATRWHQLATNLTN